MRKNKLLFIVPTFFAIPILLGCNSGGDTPTEPVAVDFTLSENETMAKKSSDKEIKITLGEKVDTNKVDIYWYIKEDSRTKIKEKSKTSDNLNFTFSALENTEESKPAELIVRIEAKDKSTHKDQTCFITVVDTLPTYTVTYKKVKTYDVETEKIEWENHTSQTVDYGEKSAKPTDPEKITGLYDFAGWYVDENWSQQFNFSQMIKSDLTLYSGYARNNQKVVVFANAFEEYDYVLVNQGEYCPKPADPIKRGYDFKGWYLNDELFDFDKTPITESILLKGKSDLIEYKINYDYAGGSLTEGENPTTYNINTPLTTLSKPTKKYYEFLNYVDQNENEISTIGGGDIGDLNITAKYTTQKFTITYHNVDGLENPNPTEYGVETPLITLKPVYKRDYFFASWYADEDFQTPVISIEPSLTLKNIDLYGKFKDYLNFTSCAWSIVSEYANKYENGTITEAEFAKHFGNNQGVQFTNANEMVGSLRTVYVNKQPHLVRVIGANYDKDEKDKNLALTFEFANLISDKDGHSLAYQWQDQTEDVYMNQNYIDSSIRKALCGSGNFSHTVYCASKNESNKWSDEYSGKTIFSMIENDVQTILKTVKKKVCIGKKFDYKDYSDKLFMLSISEIGLGKYEGKEKFSPYSYYSNDKQLVNRVIKKQVDNSSIYKNSNVIDVGKGQQCTTNSVYCEAGYNASLNSSGGGAYWLRSPQYQSESANHFCSYFIPCDQAGYEYEINRYAKYGFGFIQKVWKYGYGIAPAFCI